MFSSLNGTNTNTTHDHTNLGLTNKYPYSLNIFFRSFNDILVSQMLIFYFSFKSLRASLNLSSTTANVDLIYNGVSDKYETLYPYLENVNNEGGMELLTKEDLGHKKVFNHKYICDQGRGFI